MAELVEMESYIKRGTATFHKANIALFASALITFANLYSTQAILPIFTATFGVSPTIASLSLSLPTISLACSLLIFGSLSEAWGRKNIMSICIVISSFLTIAIAFAPSFNILLILRVMQGTALAGVPAIAMAYLGEEMEAKSIGIAMGLYISGNTIGGLSGRVIMGSITDLFSWQIAMIFLSVISLIASVFFIWALPPSKHFQAKPLALKALCTSLFTHMKNPILVCLFFIAFFTMGSFVTVFNYLGFKLASSPYNLSMTVISWIFLVYLVGTFSSTWFGILANKFGRPLFVMIGILLMLAGILLTLPIHLFFTLFGVMMFTFGFFGSHAVASGFVSTSATHDFAQASSLYLFAYYVGASIGGTVSGVFWIRYEWVGIVSFVIALLIISILLAYYMGKLSQHKKRYE